MPAASIAVVRAGRLTWQRAFGVKDTGTNEPVDGDSVFAACSNTKPVFAYGVMKLVERGLLDLDTPLTRYTKRRVTTDPRIELITARHVLNHTTGFPTGICERLEREVCGNRWTQSNRSPLIVYLKCHPKISAFADARVVTLACQPILDDSQPASFVELP